VARRRAAHDARQSQEAERLRDRGGAATRRRAAELRRGERQRERGQRGVQESLRCRPLARRGEEEAHRGEEQAAETSEAGPERKACDQAGGIGACSDSSRRIPEREPERGGERAPIERFRVHPAARRIHTVWTVCSDAQ
jgi:hypothetical protein